MSDDVRRRIATATSRLRETSQTVEIRRLTAEVRRSLDETDQLIAQRQAYLDGFCDGQRSRRWGFRVYRGK